MRSIFSILLLSISFLAAGQLVDTVRVKSDWNPSRIHFGVDANRFYNTVVKSYETSYGGMVDIDMHKFFVVLEGGLEKNHRIASYEYTNQGLFFKAGVDYNLIPHNIYRNAMSLGVRYASSYFSDQLVFEDDNYWYGNRTATLSNDALSAQWVEILINLKVRIWKNLFLGSIVRIETLKNLSDTGHIVPYDVPGWGRNRKSGTDLKTTNMGFSYYVIWNLAFREKEIPNKKQN